MWDFFTIQNIFFLQTIQKVNFLIRSILKGLKMRTLSNHLFRSWFFILFVFCLPFITSCESRKTIVNGLDEKEANEIVVLLSNKGVDTYKVPSTEGGGTGTQKLTLWDVSVPTDRSIDAMTILNQNGLPRRKSQNLLGIFGNVGLVPSDLEQQIRYQAGLAEQIASTIRKIDGVLDAEVQISFPKEDPLNPNEKKGKITASVYVKHNGVLDDPNSHLINKLKRLVASSITGLDFDNVTVISERAQFNQGGFSSSAESENEKQLVTVWSVVLAKESLTRFRVIFFSFCIIILLLLIGIAWVGWKLYPVFFKEQGWKQLFTLAPFNFHVEKKPEEKPPEAEEKKEEKPSDDEGVT